jgi:hypothetical protein
MSPDHRDPFRINNSELYPDFLDDLAYQVRYSYFRIRKLLGGSSSASELEINNGIGELVVALRRKMTNYGAVFKLRRELSLHTDLSDSESYCEAAKGKFLEILKAGHADTAREFHDEFKQGIDFSEEIEEGFFHLCTQPMPALHVTLKQGDVETEETTPEHWEVSFALRAYKAFGSFADFQSLCEKAIAQLLQEGRREDALALHNTFKSRLRLSNLE